MALINLIFAKYMKAYSWFQINKFIDLKYKAKLEIMWVVKHKIRIPGFLV